MKNAVTTFDRGLASGDLWMGPLGAVRQADLDRWRTEPGPADLSVLARALAAPGPSLDVGCGPGRMAGWLAARGADATGIDVSPGAVTMTRERGATAVLGDVLDPQLVLGPFGSAVLVDGNIGIGGDPVVLLARVRALLAPGGVVLVEVAPPGTETAITAMVLRSGEQTSEPFPWAVVGADGVDALAADAGLLVAERWSVPDHPRRHFVALVAAAG